jgi:hypothetical protein
LTLFWRSEEALAEIAASASSPAAVMVFADCNYDISLSVYNLEIGSLPINFLER